MKCDFRKRLGLRETLFGTWITIGHTDVPDLLEEAGFDWFVFDMEHAPLGAESVSRLIQVVDSAAVCPIVRVGAIEQYPVKSALDMGAHGVVFPLVNSREDAERAVSYVKYPPWGIRGVAPRKAADYGRTFSEYLKTANDLTTVVVQIETKEALRNLDEVIGTRGVDVAFVGPTDLTVSLGLGDDRGNPKVLEAMEKVVRACEKQDRAPGVLAATTAEAKRAVEMGFRFIGLGSDTRFLMSGAKEFLDAARKAR